MITPRAQNPVLFPEVKAMMIYSEYVCLEHDTYIDKYL